MRRIEPIDPYLPGGDSPVPIPSVEEAWAAMHQRLDVEMPVKRRRRRGFWLFLLLLPLLLWWWVAAVHRGAGPTGGATTAETGVRRVDRGSGKSRGGGRIVSAEEKMGGGKQKGSAKGETGGGERKQDQGEEATRVVDRGGSAKTGWEPGKIGRGPDKIGRKSGDIGAMPERSGGRAMTNKDGSGRNGSAGRAYGKWRKANIDEPQAVAVEAERATWDRSITTDAPPLNTRHKPDAVAKATKQPVRRPDPKSRKPNTPDSVKSKKPEDRILFAAGLAGNKSFPVGAQQVVDINANLKKDIWFDYIPTPYFQYHPTRRLYFQFGIQFNCPQYTEAVTIFAKPGTDTTGAAGSQFVNDTNIVVRKLYYYNFPLTVYFSPIRNLHLGAGIQYSNLRNGIAFQNNVVHYLGTGPSRDTTTFAKVVDLKDDKPAYRNLKHGEWRALFELNYYWKRITLGVQYQQALDKYLHQPVPGSKGEDRNSSLNLYLRYNIWEKRVPVKN